ncbi:MAG: tetratricopeptide repeat protein [Planctomycetes bacterium]|nr:tetratricopeptide repeat protein [Planctomycetota bacterium]
MGRTRIYGLDRDQVGRLLSLGTEGAGDEQGAGPQSTVAAPANLERPGAWIGRYKLLDILGEGGMGMVYLAEQEGPIRRQVALKVIKPGMDSKRVIARFEAERQALALLDHPNIAQVYDAGTTDSGRPYFVMEHIKGLPITDYCDRHKLTIDERLRLFQQVCHGVQHAHQKGIIHRDIKPSNILVLAAGDEAIPKIIDFGVAKAISQPLTERTLVTEDNHLLGTPEYMSPEQADMASEDIDTRSDIYSLGVLLYVLLAGILPYDSETFRQGGIEHIRKTIRETDPKTPSTRLTKLGEEAKTVAESRRTEVATLARCLRRELEWIPLKAMRKERAERYRSASELADEIENYLQGKPLIAGPPSTIYRLKKSVRRHKALVGGLAAVLAVCLIGTMVSVIFALGQARARAEADRQAKISQAVSDFLREDLLASVDPTKAKGRELTVRSFLDTASENLEGKFRNEPLVESSIRDTLGWTYRMLGEIKAAEPHLERALQIRQEQLGQEHPETLNSMGRLGWVYCDQGRYGQAERLWAKKLEISRRVLGDEHPITLVSMNDLGIAYTDLGRYDEAEQLFSKGFQTSRNVLGEQHESTFRLLGNLGQVYEEQGRYDEAEALYLKTRETQRRVWGDENPYTLAFMTFLARVYRQQGRYEESESLYLKTLKMQRRVLGEEHVYSLWSIEGLGRLYAGQGRYEQAEKALAEALEGLRKVRGKEHRDTVRCMNGLAELYTARRRFDEAKPLLTNALDIGRRTLGDDHPVTLESINDLGVLYIQQARHEDAERLLKEAFEGREAKLGREHPHTIKSLRQLVTLYGSWGKSEEAEKWRAKLPQREVGEE